MGFFSKDDDKDKPDPLELLKNLVPLNTLSEADVITLRDSSTFKELKKGDFAFKEGDSDPQNVYLLKGELALLAGKDEVDSITEGAATARFPIAHDIPRTLSARAKKAASIVVIDNHLLSKLLAVGSGNDYEVSDEMGGEDDWMTQLLRSEVFQRLPASSIQGVMMHMEEIEVAKGEKIIIEGERGDFYYLVHKGKADVSIDGKIVNRLGPGDRFGEDALLSGFPRNATISLLTDGILVRLAREDFVRYVYKPLANGVDLKSAEERISDGAMWIDVRTAAEFAGGSMPDARNLPFEGFRSRLTNLDDAKTYICCDSDEKKASAAAFALVDRGYNAFFLKSGIPADRIKKPKVAPAPPPPAAKNEDVEALKKRLAEAETTSKEYLDKLKKAKAAIDRSKAKRESEKKDQMARDQERRQMRETLMKLKGSLETKNSELERTRAHAEEAEQMRKRLERMDQLLTTDSKAGKKTTPIKISDTERVFKEELIRQEEKQGSLESELSEALHRLDDIESQRSHSENLKKQLEAAQARQESTIERISELQKREQANHGELVAADAKVQELEKTLAKRGAGDGGAQARMETEELRKQLEIARLERDRAQSNIDKLQQERQRSQGDLDKSGEVIFKLQRDLEERERRELAQEEEYKRTLETLEKQLEEVKSSQEQAQKTSLAMEEERKRMAAELEAARNQLKAVEAKAGGEVEKLQRELEETRKRAEANARGGKSSDAEQREAEQRMLALQKRLKKQQEDLKHSESEREGLKEFLESRSGELQDLKRALTDAQVEAEEADFRRQEAEEARKQVESALSKLHEQTEYEKAKSGTISYDEEGNEVRVEPKSKTGLVVGLLLLLGLGGGGAFWFVNQPQKPPVTQPPQVTATPTAEEPPASQPDAPPVEEPQAPQVVDHSGESLSGTPFRELLKDGGEAPRLAYIRGGEFVMGNLSDPWMQEENPQHHVRIKSFYMGRYEITFEEYDAFAKATKRRLPDDIGFGRGDHPVINVKWEDAQAYTQWLSAQTGAKYRLPSEAEWEYAARGGTKTDYWWGNDAGMNRANCFNCSSKWDGRSTAPVGTFKPNAYGLYNTAGNVMEWTQDCYNPSYRNSPGDGSAWLEGDCQLRVVRGSAYNRPAQSMRTSKRNGMDKDEYIPIIGFRVVRELGSESQAAPGQ